MGHYLLDIQYVQKSSRIFRLFFHDFLSFLNNGLLKKLDQDFLDIYYSEYTIKSGKKLLYDVNIYPWLLSAFAIFFPSRYVYAESRPHF